MGLVIYAILAQQNIGKLFIAAEIPGLLAAIGYMAAIAAVVPLDPSAGPAGPRLAWRVGAKCTACGRCWRYSRRSSAASTAACSRPTEAASIGVITTTLVAWGGGMRPRQFVNCLLSTAESTAMIFFILLGADLLNVFLALSQLPAQMAARVQGLGLEPLLVPSAILLL